MLLMRSGWKAWLLWAGLSLLVIGGALRVDLYADEAYISEMTARVLRGELPNVDFSANYFGLLYFYNALWFKALGKSLLTLHISMWVTTSVVFAPLVYSLSRQLMSRFWAMATTLLVLSLTVFIHMGVSGNWYALYLVLAAFALWLYRERWESKPGYGYFGIGILLGLAFLMKHSLAAYGGMALFYCTLLTGALEGQDQQTNDPSGYRWRVWLGKGLMAVGLLGTPLLIASVQWAHLSIPSFVVYVLPAIGLSGYIAKILYQQGAKFSIDRWFLNWLAVIGGFSLVFGLFLIPFALREGGIPILFQKVLVEYPQIYLRHAYLSYLDNINWLAAQVVLWFVAVLWLASQGKAVAGWLVFLVGLVVVTQLPWDPSLAGWVNANIYSMLQMPVWILLIGGLMIWKKQEQMNTLTAKELTPLFFWILGFFLFQNTYPLGVPFYFAYSVTPLLILTGYGLSRWFHGRPWGARTLALLLVGYWVSFGGLVLYRVLDFYTAINNPLIRLQEPSVLLPGPRGGIYMTPGYGERILQVVKFIQTHSTRPDDIFIFSDEPVLYFLTDHINPTRYSYAIDSTLSDGAEIIAALEKHQIQYVFIGAKQNGFPQPLLQQYLQANFYPVEMPHPEVMVLKRL